MARKTRYNPERRTWKGKSYKKRGERVDDLRDASDEKENESDEKDLTSNPN